MFQRPNYMDGHYWAPFVRFRAGNSGYGLRGAREAQLEPVQSVVLGPVVARSKNGKSNCTPSMYMGMICHQKLIIF